MPAPVLIHDPQMGFREHLISEIYLGPNSNSNGVVVPNVNDSVRDWTKGIYRVVSVDSTSSAPDVEPTYIPELVLVHSFDQVQDLPLNGYRIYANSEVFPYSLTIDGTYKIDSTDLSYFKVFKGRDISADGQVISQVFDVNGNYVNENISFETVGVGSAAVRRPQAFNTSALLETDDILTAVFYNSLGTVLVIQEFKVVNTNAVRPVGFNTPVITDVRLITPLLDSVDPGLINAPMGMPSTSSIFSAELVYSNGSTSPISVDGTKCKLLGLENFNNMLSDGTTDILLTYYLDSDEAAVNVQGTTVRSVSHEYRIRTVEINKDFSFKVYPVPKFNSATNTYQLEFWITKLDYSFIQKLDPAHYTVKKLNGSAPDLSAHPGNQTLVITADLSYLNQIGYQNFTFVQSFTINLGYTTGVNWLIDFKNNGQHVFGQAVQFQFSVPGTGTISVRTGAVTIESWLQTLYNSIHPLYDESVRLTFPRPTHFQLIYKDNSSAVLPIDPYWKLYINNSGNFPNAFENNATMIVSWIYEDPITHDYSYLGLTPVVMVNTL